MMKKIAIALLICLSLTGAALADTLEIDLDTATVQELTDAMVQLEARIEAIHEASRAGYAELDDYQDYIDNADANAGSAVRFVGRVAQVAEGIGSVQAVIALRGHGDMPILITYTPSDALPMLAQGDTVEVYGEFSGLTTVNDLPHPTVTTAMLDPADAARLDAGATTGLGQTGDDFGVEGYMWSNAWANYLALAVRNNTGENVELNVRVIFKDRDGNMVGVDNASEHAVGPGCQTVLILRNDDAFDAYEYEVTGSAEKYYASVLQSLESDIVITGQKAIITTKNQGDIAAEFVQCYVLFMSGEDVVDYDYAYMTDSDNEIKPGSFEMREFSTRESFDSIKVFYAGRGDK